METPKKQPSGKQRSGKKRSGMTPQQKALVRLASSCDQGRREEILFLRDVFKGHEQVGTRNETCLQASPSLSVASGAGSFLGSLFGFTPTKKRAAIDQPIDQPTSTHKKRRARRTSPILEVDSEAELEDEIQADDEIEEAEEIQDQADDKTWNTMPPAQLVSTLTLAYIESLHDGDVAGAFLACLDANLVAYRGLHVQALIVFARRMGVPCNGGKSDIVRRLKAYADAEE